MAKPVYFYGIHAVQSLLQHRGMDGLALFIQDTKQADSNVVTMVQLAQQLAQDSQTQPPSSPRMERALPTQQV